MRIMPGLAVVIVAFIAGCNIIGPAAYLIGGLPKRPAAYILEERPTVVFVDDRANRIASNAPAVKRALAEAITQEIIRNELVPFELMKSPLDAMAAARAQDRYGELVPIDEIARRVGAEQMVYVEVLGFSLAASDGITPRPTASVAVRVIDAINQTRVFPFEGSPSGVVEATGREVDPAVARSTGAKLRVYEGLALLLGREVGKLFYEHEVRMAGENLGQP